MADSPTPILYAIVTTNKDLVLQGGMASVFYAKDEDMQHNIAMWISRITNATVHNLPDGTVILTTSH